MNETDLLAVWQGALQTTALVSMPFLAASLVVGVFTSLIQAATQLQENAISFIPKVLVIFGLIVWIGNWALAHLVHFSVASLENLAKMAVGNP